MFLAALRLSLAALVVLHGSLHLRDLYRSGVLACILYLRTRLLPSTNSLSSLPHFFLELGILQVSQPLELGLLLLGSFNFLSR